MRLGRRWRVRDGRRHRLLVSLLFVGGLVGALASASASSELTGASSTTPVPGVARLAAAAVTFPAPSWIDTVGPIALSSPTVATIEGVTAVVFASEDP